MIKKTALFKKCFFGAMAAFFTLTGAFASWNSYGIPDSAEIREKISSTYFDAPVDFLRTQENQVLKNDVNENFQISFNENEKYFIIAITPQTTIEIQYQNGDLSESRQKEVFTEGSAGSWILYKNLSTSKAEKVRWYFNADSEVYLEFSAEAKKTFADLILYDTYLVKHAPLGLPFSRLYTASFEEIQNWTKNSIPWKKVTVKSGQYWGLLQTALTVRKYLPKMENLQDALYNEDGILCDRMTDQPYTLLDEDGNPYSAKKDGLLQLDSAGFIKWIVDGLIYPYTGSYSDSQSLYQPTVEFNLLSKTGVLNEKYDIAFALNWTRNLALKAWNVRNVRQLTYKDCGLDLSYNHFAKVPSYVKDTGYQIDLLKPLLYVQALIEPGYAYLGAVKEFSVTNREDFVFNNEAAIFPYFDDKGHFDCLVFENGKEMTLDEFMNKYKNSFVNLVRVKCSEDFYPLENF